MEIGYIYTKKRAAFGRPCHFSTRPTELDCEIKADPTEAESFVPRTFVDRCLQTGYEKSEHEVNTEHRDFDSRGFFHCEGGWPRDVNPNEIDQVNRYRRKVEKDDMYINTVKVLADVMENYILQNNALDIYENYFSGVPRDPEMEIPSARAINRFCDPNEVKRPVSRVSWFSDGPRKLAIAHCSLDFRGSVPVENIESYIWDIENPIHPEMTIKPGSPLVCLEFNPKDSHNLIGGQYNGQIAFWDTRRSSNPIETSVVEIGHRDPVYSVVWLQSKTGTECFSATTDGQVMWWDVRKMDAPTENMYLDPTKRQDPGSVHGATSLEYEPTIPTKFMAGTEQGTIISCNRRAKTPAEKVSTIYTGHIGPVYALQRNPFFPKNFLSVGDWRARIWSEDNKESSIWWTKNHLSYLTDGCWSPTRPSVFFTTQMDGTLDIWDLIHKQKDALLTLQVCDQPIHGVRIHDLGRLIAVGSEDGTTTLLELSDGLATLQKNEKAKTLGIFERESKREKLLEVRHREQKLRASMQSRSKSSKADAHSRSEITPEIEELLAKAEKDFYSAIEAERKKRAREHERTSEGGSGQWFGTEEEKRDHGKASPILEVDENSAGLTKS